MPQMLDRGRFQIRRELGRGGMGVVYEAIDKERNVPVALKTLLQVHADEIYNLKKEFRALQDIVHPNLCGLQELMVADGRWFFVMELVRGQDFLTYATCTDKETAHFAPRGKRASVFYEVASAELNRQGRYPRLMTLAFVDLDNFKEVNDRHGHKIGDMALVAVANAMRAATRTTDILSRLGGDEFALLLPETDLEGARRLLQRLSADVAQAMAASYWPVSCSIGAVTFDTPPDNVDAIITAADHLMYRVKASGKSAVRIEPFRAHESPTPRSDSLASGETPG